MNRKVLSLLMGSMLVASLFAGCSKASTSAGKTENKKVVIAGIYKAGDQVWFIDEGKAAKKMAAFHGSK